MAAFWIVAPCSPAKFADVSEVLAASTISVLKMEAIHVG
jgi:hypothetical protein